MTCLPFVSSTRIWCSSYRVPATAHGGSAASMRSTSADVCVIWRVASDSASCGTRACTDQRHRAVVLGKKALRF